MKKSYTLLGTFLDGKDSHIDRIPAYQVESDIGYYEDYRTERTLFDINTVIRAIRLSEILRFKNETEFNRAMNSLLWCDKIFMLIDFLPQAPSTIVTDFFIKRLVQAYLMVKTSNDQADVSLLAKDCFYDKLHILLEDYVLKCSGK